MIRALSWFCVVALPAVVLGGLWFGRRDFATPNVVLPTQMSDSPALRAQNADPGAARQAPLPGGMAMQTAPDRTLARNAHPFRYRNTPAERKRAGRELTNPEPDTPEVLAKGKRLYETFCLPCHGVAGNGDGPLIPKYPNPPNFRGKQSMELADGEMFHTVTVGFKKMASYASQLDWNERWRVIRYIRTLQKEGSR